MSTQASSVLVVEDESVVARDIQRCLEADGFRIVGVARSGREALALFAQHRPDVVLMDIKLAGELDGVDVAERLASLAPTPIVYLTAYSDPQTVQRTAATNVAGYVLKPFADRQLVSAVRVAAAKRPAAESGERRVSDALMAIAGLVSDVTAGQVPGTRWQDSLELARLTPRERQIVELLWNNMRVSAIARRLGSSPHTVRNQLKSVFRKLGVHSQDELLEWIRRR